MDSARLIFMWSRMRVIDEDDPQHRQRIENLTFWGFLEAIVRAAATPRALSSQCTQRVQCTTESAALCVCVAGTRRPLQGDAHGGGGGGGGEYAW